MGGQMPIRFYRRVSIFPGLRLNLSKKNASLSIGGRGIHYTIGTSGERTTIGIPGSGLSWTQQKQLTSVQRAARIQSCVKLFSAIVAFAIVLWAISLLIPNS